MSAYKYDVWHRVKPKKGRGGPRDAKRVRASSEQDFDYEDDPDLTLWLEMLENLPIKPFV